MKRIESKTLWRKSLSNQSIHFLYLSLSFTVTWGTGFFVPGIRPNLCIAIPICWFVIETVALVSTLFKPTFKDYNWKNRNTVKIQSASHLAFYLSLWLSLKSSFEHMVSTTSYQVLGSWWFFDTWLTKVFDVPEIENDFWCKPKLQNVYICVKL